MSQPPPNAASAVVFWNGVNGCKPSANANHQYVWQDNAANLSQSLQHAPGQFAEPFGIMSRANLPPEQVGAQLDAYLADCKAQGKRPLVVMSPHLNIEGYLATLSPDKLNPATLAGEIAVRKDLAWTKSVTPLVLEKLSAAGYEISGYAHSWGGTMAAQGILRSDCPVNDLTVMNARVPNADLKTLESQGLLGSMRRITTHGDALTYFGKAAFGKGDVYIKRAEVPGWGSPTMGPNHNVVLCDPSTPLSVEIGGVTVETDLGSVLRGDVVSGGLRGESLTSPLGGQSGRESGVSMRMEVDEGSFRSDDSGELETLRERVLGKRRPPERPFWTPDQEEQQQ